MEHWSITWNRLGFDGRESDGADRIVKGYCRRVACATSRDVRHAGTTDHERIMRGIGLVVEDSEFYVAEHTAKSDSWLGDGAASVIETMVSGGVLIPSRMMYTFTAGEERAYFVDLTSLIIENEENVKK